MRGFEKPVADLIRGTAMEDNEVEQARLRKLPLEEQLEVGIVLYEAMLQEKRPNGVRNGVRDGRLAGVRSIADVRRFLDDQSRSSP